MVWIVYKTIFGSIRVLRGKEEFFFEAQVLDLGYVSTNCRNGGRDKPFLKWRVKLVYLAGEFEALARKVSCHS